MGNHPDIEVIAELLHQGWLDCQHAKGVVFGPIKTASTHPHFVSWDKLDTESQNQDRFIASVILHDWYQGTLSLSNLPAAIHDTWAEWAHIQGENHPHARPYQDAHRDGDDEHTRQAKLIAQILGNHSASHND